ncbi:MAG: phenylalanine--tRNA ligase beta subunit-related protein, partial [Acidobacteriota bacterium]
LKYLIPCGGDDMDTVSGDVTLGLASSEETFAPLFSPDAVEHPDAGEIIYVNRMTGKVLCRRWNWRNADFSKINPESKNIAVNVDGMIPSIGRDEIEAAAEELRALLVKGCGGTISIHYLDMRNPVLEL